jgi:hypothetical protein
MPANIILSGTITMLEDHYFDLPNKYTGLAIG